MDGDPPVETSGAANREARQHGSEEAGNEAWRVSEEAAWQQHGPTPGLLDQHGSQSPAASKVSQQGQDWPTLRGSGGGMDGGMGLWGLVRWRDALLLRRKGGAKAFCLAGSMMTADGGFWMAGGRQQDWPTTAPPPATQHQPQPHHTNAPLGGSTNPTAPCILSTGHSPSTWCPREILGTGV